MIMKKTMKEKVFKIPNKPITYKQGEAPPSMADHKLIFEPEMGEKIDVLVWSQYPSYDFIFGVPAKGSPRAKLECGFIAFRDSRTGKQSLLYIDETELDDFVRGIECIHEAVRSQK